MSDEWAAYRREVFGDPYLVWHDGADFTAVAERFQADPDLVLQMLRSGIGENDAVAAEAARNLAPTPDRVASIVTMLEGALPGSSGGTRSEIATSLHALGGGDPADLAQHVVDVMLGTDHWGVRLDAAIRLSTFAPTADLVAAAAAGVRDGEYLVRFHAANTLLAWAGRDEDISDDEELFGLLRQEDDPRAWAEAAQTLAAAVKL